MHQHKDYIGDGVYVQSDGYHIWIGLQQDREMIALEPPVFEALIRYRDRIFAEAKQDAPSSPI